MKIRRSYSRTYLVTTKDKKGQKTNSQKGEDYEIVLNPNGVNQFGGQ